MIGRQRQSNRTTTEIRGEITGLRGGFKYDLARRTRTMVFMMLGIAITIRPALLPPSVGG